MADGVVLGVVVEKDDVNALPFLLRLVEEDAPLLDLFFIDGGGFFLSELDDDDDAFACLLLLLLLLLFCEAKDEV